MLFSATERPFALLYFMLTGRAAHKPLLVYSCFNFHKSILSYNPTKVEG